MTADILYTPWRMKYVTSNKQSDDDCVFCAKLHSKAADDRQNYVIYRGKNTFVVMNTFPYTTGHLMILPHQHVSTLAEVHQDAQLEMMLLISYFTQLLSDLMQPDGFNVGINIGRASGAGMASHLHTHIVPRWSGDNNFMSVVGQTRILPETLDDTYGRITAFLRDHPPEITL